MATGPANHPRILQLLSAEPLASVATGAIAFHNDVEITVNREMSDLLGYATCDVQRNFAASIWMRWNELGVGAGAGAGAGVTVKSYTGRVLASAEQGLGGARCHCQ